jgi:hypothetical protein
MIKEHKYVEYQGNFYIIVGFGYQTKTPYSDRGDEHYYDCIILSSDNLRVIPSVLVGKTIQIFLKDAREVTDKKRLKMLEIFYG